MLYTEVLDSLESLSNEEIGRMFRLIIKWNKGEVVEPQDSLEKFVWATIEPKLVKDKDKYLETSEKRKEAVNKRWSKQKDTNEYKSIQMNTNSSPNSSNSSKEELTDMEQPSSSKDESVVSKGLESLENIFPASKNYVGIEEINLWNGLSQEEKKVMIKRASLYIRNEMKKDDGKYIKKMGKWMREQTEKGLEEKTPSMKTKSSSTKQTFKYQDGTIYNILETKLGSSTDADTVWNTLNIFGLEKQEFLDIVRTETKESLLEMIKK